MPVKIITDSVADIPTEVVDELGISIIPVVLHFGEEAYHDGIDITTDQFYEKLVESKVMPTTSVPSPDVFMRTYARLAEETDEVLGIILSSKLSGLYNEAVQSVSLVNSKCRIEIIDSGCAVMEQGLVVIKAARAAKDGASLDELLDIVRTNLPRSEMLAAFDTLEFLQRGGRIGRAQALLGSMLKINPLVTLKNGVVEPAGRTRSRTKALDRLYKYAESYSHIEEMAVEGADCPDDVDNLVKRLGAIFPEERIYRCRTTPVIGTHTGPGLILVAILGDK